jgi:hypothetical protein
MIADEKQTHRGHRDLLAAYFQARPGVVVSHQALEALVGRNYQQRISDARRDLGMHIENVKRTDECGKLLTGDYRYVPATETVSLDSYREVPLFDV